jgi:hypothetical protein
MTRKLGTFVFATAFLTSLAANAAVPQSFSVQGVLHDKNNNLQSSTSTVVIKFFGNQMTTSGETRLNKNDIAITGVAVVGGLFTVNIPLTDDLKAVFGNPAVWLELTVDSDTFARQLVTPNVYALMCGNSDTLGGNQPSYYVDTQTSQTISGVKTFAADVVFSPTGSRLTADQGGAIELGTANSVANATSKAAPYIDFHYGSGRAEDFNVRLMNDNDGWLSLNRATAAVDTNNKPAGGLWIGNSGNLHVDNNVSVGQNIWAGNGVTVSNLSPIVAEAESGSGRYGRFMRTGGNGGNLHIDSFYPAGENGGSTFINWYSGRGVVIGNGAQGLGPIQASAINTGSSLRFKQDIRETRYGLSELLKLQPKSYAYIKDPTHARQIGFIAEEMIKVIPEIVHLDVEGKPDGIDYSKLAVVLVNAVKTLTGRIDDNHQAVEAMRERQARSEAALAQLKADNTQLRLENAAFKARLDHLENTITTLAAAAQPRRNPRVAANAPRQ